MNLPLRRKPQAIDMRSRRFGYFPRTFVWRGHEYQVESVVRCWTTTVRKCSKHHFEVKCAEGKFHLYQDLQYNTWHIQP